MKIGKLDFTKVDQRSDLLAESTVAFIKEHSLREVWAADIDSTLADTAEFCQHYDIKPQIAANCVVLKAKRADKTWYAACLVLATTRADINSVVRRELGAKKISFAPMEVATSLTGMEYGGITPLGLPADWPVFVDARVIRQQRVVVGSGIRKSKLLIDTAILKTMPNVLVKDIAQ